MHVYIACVGRKFRSMAKVKQSRLQPNTKRFLTMKRYLDLSHGRNDLFQAVDKHSVFHFYSHHTHTTVKMDSQWSSGKADSNTLISGNFSFFCNSYTP